MSVEFTSGGIHVPAAALWLDPAGARETAWISHAHPSHARALHSTVIATPETLELYRLLYPDAPASSLRPLPFLRPMTLGDARLTAFPSGHLPGAAQLLIETGGDRILYTGDVKFRAPLLGAEAAAVPCDRLIVESAYGLPIYHFLSREQARTRILQFARECFEQKDVPVFLCGPLGPAQEVAHVLSEAGIAAELEPPAARYAPFYQRHGFRLDTDGGDGRALIAGKDWRRPAEAKRHRAAFVSGRAALDNGRARAGAEELIPYSSHADFEDLLALVESAAPREIDVVHGYAEAFAHILYQRGWNARAREIG